MQVTELQHQEFKILLKIYHKEEFLELQIQTQDKLTDKISIQGIK